MNVTYGKEKTVYQGVMLQGSIYIFLKTLEKASFPQHYIYGLWLYMVESLNAIFLE